jgi:hypothetical protein
LTLLLALAAAPVRALRPPLAGRGGRGRREVIVVVFLAEKNHTIAYFLFIVKTNWRSAAAWTAGTSPAKTFFRFFALESP